MVMDSHQFAAWADETAAQLLARSCSHPISTGVLFAGALRAGHVLEMSGPSGAAKSEALVQVAAACVLPRGAGGAALGREENVVLLDLDAKFDELRLFQVLSVRLSQALQQRPEEVCELARTSLQRFHLVQCDSSFQLLATLRTLKPLLSKLQAGAGLQLLLIDNLSAFYWQDRAVHQAAAERVPQAMSFSLVHAAIVAELRKLLRHHHLAVVATCHDLLHPAGAGPAAQGVRGAGQESLWAHREVLPKPWLDLVTHRLLLRRLPPGGGGGGACFASRWLGGEDRPLAFGVAEGCVLRA